MISKEIQSVFLRCIINTSMKNNAKQEITVLLKSLKQGDKSTQDEIMKILYQELQRATTEVLLSFILG